MATGGAATTIPSATPIAAIRTIQPPIVESGPRPEGAGASRRRMSGYRFQSRRWHSQHSEEPTSFGAPQLQQIVSGRRPGPDGLSVIGGPFDRGHHQGKKRIVNAAISTATINTTRATRSKTTRPVIGPP